jgi:hypothetical protein
LEALFRKLKGEPPPRFRFAWTVDRERDSYYFVKFQGREEFSNHSYSILYYKGKYWNVVVSLEDEGSISFHEDPYRIIWGLQKISLPDGGIAPYDEIIPVLKEALAAYQVSGVNTPDYLRNIVTTFKF